MALAMEGPCGPASDQGPEACEQRPEGRGCGEPEDSLGRGGLGAVLGEMGGWPHLAEGLPQRVCVGGFGNHGIKLHVALGVEEMAHCGTLAEP